MNSELEKQLNEVYVSKESINPYLYAKDDQLLIDIQKNYEQI